MDGDEATLLHFAAVSEAPKTLKYLLENQASLSRFAKTRKRKESPLFWAARTGRPANIKILCTGVAKDDLNPELSALNSDGMGLLHVAASSCQSGRLDSIRELCNAGANDDARANARLVNKATASMIAAQRGDLELLKVLVEMGTDLTANDKLGKTLVIYSAVNGHLNVLTFVMGEGVDVDAKDSSGNTAVHYAAAYGWEECLEALLEIADPDATNNWSNNPLLLALKNGSLLLRRSPVGLGGQSECQCH